MQLFYQFVKRHFPVLESLQGSLFNLVQQTVEAGNVRQIGSHQEGIRQWSDQVLEFRLISRNTR